MDMMQGPIFWGTLSSDPDTNKTLLSPPDTALSPIQVDANLALEVLEFMSEFQQQLPLQVSILGVVTTEDAEVGPGEVLQAHCIVTHDDIAVRAFEICQSRHGGSAFDNWLSAERQLLDSAKAGF